MNPANHDFYSKLFLFLFVSLIATLLPAANEKETGDSRGDHRTGEHVAGRIETIDFRTQSLGIRAGDATTTFSFDNRTVFTYGDRTVSVREMKIGDEVVVSAKNGKAAAVNGTELMEGIIERIDSKSKKLIVKIGDRIKEIPFQFFWVATPDGKAAPVENMKAGDKVLLNVNLASSGKEISPKPEP